MLDLHGIAGVGVDLCAISRIERAMEKERFLERFYTLEERDYLSRKGKGSVQSAAAMFAAKEAVTKALGTGIAKGVCLNQISVTHDELGAPGVKLTDTALQRMQEIGGSRVLLSLSHEGDMAIAFAVIEA